MLRLTAIIHRQTLISIRNFINSILNFFINLFTFLTTMHRNTTDDAHQPLLDPNPSQSDSSEASIPISFPITKLEDLESRSYFESFDFEFNKSTVPIPSGLSLPDRERILVCHDMQGGYTDNDKLIQGGSSEDAYAIWHWYLIDVFVYFSHNLVTLPPPGWTNAAHKHGVKVLGTFITEWDEGTVICKKLLATKESAQMYAERLTELAVALGFDGWLLNVEANLDVGLIPNLKEFVSHLTQTMHSSLPGSLVIWYDSVTVNGVLAWQNQLNAQNKPFFDICDGIFVNYTWLENYPKSSAALAGDRKFDVYMGIDIFGRKTYGGGQWTTNVALDLLKKDEVSAALFAPGWVYETKQPPDFQTAQNRWWDLIEKSWGIHQKYPKVLPFYSNFDQGHGYHISVDGSQVSDAPWSNISSQSFQPFLQFAGDPNPNPIQVLVDFKEPSYSGGGNVTFKGTLEDNAHFTTRLFLGELLLGNSPVHFTYSVKLDGNSMLGLHLEFSSCTKETTSVLLACGKNPLLTANRFSTKFSKVILPFRVTETVTTPGWIIQESSISMQGHTLTEIHALSYNSKPELEAIENKSVQCSSPYNAVLGDIVIKYSNQNSDFPPSISWVVEGLDIKWSLDSQGCKNLSVNLIWKLKSRNNSLFPNYNIYVVKLPKTANVEAASEYVGVAHVETFYVSDLVVPSSASGVKFIIQVCGVDGSSQGLDDSPSFQLNVEGQ